MTIVKKRRPVRRKTTDDAVTTTDQADDTSTPADVDAADTVDTSTPDDVSHDVMDVPADLLDGIDLPKGFQNNTDSAVIVKALIHGAKDRVEINKLAEGVIAKKNGLHTRSGKPKYLPSMVSSILTRMLESGEWEVESSWKLVPKTKTPAKKRRAVRKGA